MPAAMPPPPPPPPRPQLVAKAPTDTELRLMADSEYGQLRAAYERMRRRAAQAKTKSDKFTRTLGAALDLDGA